MNLSIDYANLYDYAAAPEEILLEAATVQEERAKAVAAAALVEVEQKVKNEKSEESLTTRNTALITAAAVDSNNKLVEERDNDKSPISMDYFSDLNSHISCLALNDNSDLLENGSNIAKEKDVTAKVEVSDIETKSDDFKNSVTTFA